MPAFTFKDPTGKAHTIHGPEGATPEQAFQILQTRRPELFAAPPDDAFQVEDAPEAPSGFTMGLRGPIDATAQLLERALPEPVVSGVNAFNDWLVDRGLPLERLGDDGLQGQLNRLEDSYQDRRALEGDTGVDWDRMGGNVAGTVIPGAGFARAASIPTAATTTGRVMQGLGGGALGGALATPVIEPVDDMDFLRSKAIQAGLGAAGGATGAAVGNMLGKIGPKARDPEITNMRQMGVEPSLGETMGGPLAWTEQKLMSMPAVGDILRRNKEAARSDWNKAAVNETLAPIGKQLPDDVMPGNDAVATGARLISRAYEEAAEGVPEVPIGANVLRQAEALKIGLQGAPKEAEDSFSRFVENTLKRRLGATGRLTPSEFKKLDSDLGKKVRGTQDAELRSALEVMQKALRDEAGRVSPRYDRMRRAADAAFARMVRVKDAANRASLQDGVFTPGQLVQAAKTQDKSVGKSANAAGDALMQDFAQSGQRVIGNTVPNSGTTDRIANMLGFGGLVLDPISTALALGPASLMATGPVQRALTAGARQMPEFNAGVLTGLGSGAAVNTPR